MSSSTVSPTSTCERESPALFSNQAAILYFTLFTPAGCLHLLLISFRKLFLFPPVSRNNDAGELVGGIQAGSIIKTKHLYTKSVPFYIKHIHTHTHADIYIYVFNKYAYGLFINDTKNDRHTHTHTYTRGYTYYNRTSIDQFFVERHNYEYVRPMYRIRDISIRFNGAVEQL